MNVSVKSIIKGLLSYTPLKPFLVRKGTGGTDSARYCYSVWLRHLVLLYENGMESHPKIVAELGPGDSLGIGLSSLLTGAEKYYAFDIVKHTDLRRNLDLFDELIDLFLNKTPIPNEKEFPEIKPKLDSYKFPIQFLNNWTLNDDKIRKIKRNLEELSDPDDQLIKYVVPWYSENVLSENSVDLIYSQAVMEHVIELSNAYNIMYKWLRKDGYISHQIDYKAHETHKIWNGHWKYNDLLWEIMMHGRSYPINRKTHSEHIKLMCNAGFSSCNVFKAYRKDGYSSSLLPQKYSVLSSEDLSTASAHIIAYK